MAYGDTLTEFSVRADRVRVVDAHERATTWLSETGTFNGTPLTNLARGGGYDDGLGPTTDMALRRNGTVAWIAWIADGSGERAGRRRGSRPADACTGVPRCCKVPRMHLPPWPFVVLAAAIGVATIVVVSAYGSDARPAGYAGSAAALAILVWGVHRERDR